MGLLVGCAGPSEVRQSYVSSNIETCTFSASVRDGQTAQVEVHLPYGGTEFTGEEGTIICDDAAMEPQARKLLAWLGEATRQAHAKAAFRSTGPITWRLVRVKGFPRSLKFSFAIQNGHADLPICYNDSSETAEEILENNRRYTLLTAYFHELAEWSLASPNHKPVVLPDIRAKVTFGLIRYPVHAMHYTRWFRDGYAHYVAWTAVRSLEQHLPGPLDQAMVETHPMANLSGRGRELRHWDQYDEDDTELYGGSLGMFLACANRHGPEAIPRVIVSLSRLAYADGADVEQIWKQVTGDDPHAFARSFDWPSTGLTLDAEGRGLRIVEVEAGSAAARAGLKPDTRIVQVGRVEVHNIAMFESALHRAGWADGQAITLTVKDAQGHRTVRIPSH